MKDWTGNAKSIYATLGASNHTDAEREDNDFYATEPKALILLLERETFDDLIWEPACGKGHLSEVLKQSGYIVKSTDLVDRGYGKSGVDFLKCTTPFNGDIRYLSQSRNSSSIRLVHMGKRVSRGAGREVV